MAIYLTKTSQGTTRELSIVPEFLPGVPGVMVICRMQGHELKWPASDGFAPVLSKLEVIEDDTVVRTVQNNRDNYDLCMQVVEDYLIANVSWYAGGTTTEPQPV